MIASGVNEETDRQADKQLAFNSLWLLHHGGERRKARVRLRFQFFMIASYTVHYAPGFLDVIFQFFMIASF